MKVLVIGGGGREHAMAWKIAQSPRVTEVIVAPGNAGTAREPNMRNVAVSADDIDALLELVSRETIDLTVVGPEAPLVAGIVDRFTAAGLRCFGPGQQAARLEGSKAFSKAFMARHKIPTGAYAAFTEIQPALDYIAAQGAPIVIKADGLAAGKGVIVAQTEAEAVAAVRNMLQENTFGSAGSRVVIEEYLAGEEASFIAIVDGKTILPLATSQDHKPRDNGDTGPNTGGMGAYSPAPVITPEIAERTMNEVMRPTVDGMAQDGSPYIGFLYAGLMIDADGTPKVLEFNCRFGDPETQPVLFRLQSDFVDLIEAALDGELDQQTTDWDPRVSLGVVMAAGGYPTSYRKGDSIKGLPTDPAEAIKIFHAGTTDRDDNIVTSGGRVLCIVALGDTTAEAQQAAYQIVEKIHWPDAYYRTDIGYRAVAREHADN
ncbi:MAG: phosphoribosylamine--glycine ligase [Gammaproteobacteria bacterium]|nr:phosphoribosylamine--glycine ligase [Chromatiales bacterium]MCP4926783.1 phosphoribosylamine--glycine ligase [Gammaproteobacteria bacterium]MDP7094222.1 phosphoribosylamine--glycine ligase [Gammaproteobacteria bacterium]MDP7295928.1 phosphoribosylamine--glycine ligase [Gammaproteobacteria bacterium]MDP7419659.1 phosphoribosylamine--glycine ligase [Gammaproteobacteria bacterium]